MRSETRVPSSRGLVKQHNQELCISSNSRRFTKRLQSRPLNWLKCYIVISIGIKWSFPHTKHKIRLEISRIYAEILTGKCVPVPALLCTAIVYLRFVSEQGGVDDVRARRSAGLGTHFYVQLILKTTSEKNHRFRSKSFKTIYLGYVEVEELLARR